MIVELIICIILIAMLFGVAAWCDYEDSKHFDDMGEKIAAARKIIAASKKRQDMMRGWMK